MLRTARLSRRSLLTLGAAGAATLLAPVPARANPGRIGDPFTLGVASGDPTPDGVVLWTRLAPDPLAGDGLGGMPGRPVEVEWEIAEDDRFTREVRRGSVTARPELAHSIHVELDGLRPGRHYAYRFRVGTHLSPTGHTRTAPSPDALDAQLTMCFASCADYEHGFFTAYRRIAEEEPDVVLHLGDYMYEVKADDWVSKSGNVRDHAGPETVTLANYRQRYAQYKTDPDLQLAHAAAPWAVVWDDHELDNNWADEIAEHPEDQAGMLDRRRASFQAYYENMPLRRTSVPRGIDLQLYRRVEWGRLATFHMLDTRQYRSDQPCGDERVDCHERHLPERSILGAEQERWLLDGFADSEARWDVLGQQVFFAEMDVVAGAKRGFNNDGWDGYVASRQRITQGMVDRDVRNPVVLTGDVHAHWAAEIKADYRDPTSAPVATELVTTSVTSEGNGSEQREDTPGRLAENPHIKFFNFRRGYVKTTFTQESLRADFVALPYVTRPGAPAETRASFVVEDRNPGLQAT